MHDILLRNALIADPEADSLRTGTLPSKAAASLKPLAQPARPSTAAVWFFSPASSTRMCILVLIP